MTSAASGRRPVPRRRTGVIPWGEIRAVYEATDIPLDLLAAAYAIRTSDIYPHADAGGWMKRRRRWALERKAGRRTPGTDLPAADRAVLIGRMFRAVARQIDEIERRFGPDGGFAPDEKDARTLATLARTIDMLVALESAARPPAEDEGRGDIDEFRRQLARRIEDLRHGS